MDAKQAIDALQAGLNLIETWAPWAATLNIPTVTTIAGVAATAASIGENILQRIEDGLVVASSDEKDQIVSLTEKVAAENDRLAALIAAS